MTDQDLPPHLRESELNRISPAQELPMELPPEIDAPAPLPQPEEKDERPVDPFLRRS